VQGSWRRVGGARRAPPGVCRNPVPTARGHAAAAVHASSGGAPKGGWGGPSRVAGTGGARVGRTARQRLAVATTPARPKRNDRGGRVTPSHCRRLLQRGTPGVPTPPPRLRHGVVDLDRGRARLVWTSGCRARACNPATAGGEAGGERSTGGLPSRQRGEEPPRATRHSDAAKPHTRHTRWVGETAGTGAQRHARSQTPHREEAAPHCLCGPSGLKNRQPSHPNHGCSHAATQRIRVRPAAERGPSRGEGWGSGTFRVRPSPTLTRASWQNRRQEPPTCNTAPLRSTVVQTGKKSIRHTPWFRENKILSAREMFPSIEFDLSIRTAGVMGTSRARLEPLPDNQPGDPTKHCRLSSLAVHTLLPDNKPAGDGFPHDDCLRQILSHSNCNSCVPTTGLCHHKPSNCSVEPTTCRHEWRLYSCCALTSHCMNTRHKGRVRCPFLC